MTLGRLSLVLVLSSLAACLPPPEPGARRGAIIGGTPTTGDPGVVLLVSYPPSKASFSTCTAVVISSTAVLTTAHCIDPSMQPGYSYGVFTGADATAYDTVAKFEPVLIPVASVHPHPGYVRVAPFTADIGVAVLAQPLVGVTPPPRPTQLLGDLTGQTARLVGYGQTTYGTYNAVKHEGQTVVAGLDAGDTMRIGDAQRRTCIGDSGAPAFVSIGGVETVVGIDSYTDNPGCVEPAHFRRLDHYLDFIAGFTGSAGLDGGASGNSDGASGDDGGVAGGDAGDDGALCGDEGGCSTARAASRGPGVVGFALLAGLLGVGGRRRRARRHR